MWSDLMRLLSSIFERAESHEVGEQLKIKADQANLVLAAEYILIVLIILLLIPLVLDLYGFRKLDAQRRRFLFRCFISTFLPFLLFIVKSGLPWDVQGQVSKLNSASEARQTISEKQNSGPTPNLAPAPIVPVGPRSGQSVDASAPDASSQGSGSQGSAASGSQPSGGPKLMIFTQIASNSDADRAKFSQLKSLLPSAKYVIPPVENVGFSVSRDQVRYCNPSNKPDAETLSAFLSKNGFSVLAVQQIDRCDLDKNKNILEVWFKGAS